MEYSVQAMDVTELKALSSIKVEKQQNLIEAYEVKAFTFPNGVRVISEDAMDYLLSLLKNERDKAIGELLKLQSTKAQNTKLKNRNAVLEKELEALKKELKELNHVYGKYISPFTIIEELYRGISDPYMILIKREKFKIKISQKQFDYWIGVFISLKIIRRIDKSNVQSLLGYTDAQNTLYSHDSTWNINNGENNEQ
jgi:hypothetical protein